MKRIFTTALLILTTIIQNYGQALVEFEIKQNPFFEVFTNDINLILPDSDKSIVIGGDIVIKGGSGEYTYNWFDSSGNSLGASQTIEINKEGEYILNVSDSCNCEQSIVFNVTTASIESLDTESLIIYPNPTYGNIKIEGLDVVQLAAINMAGHLDLLIDFGGDIFHEANLSPLSPGLYIITLTDAYNKTHITKLIKK